MTRNKIKFYSQNKTDFISELREKVKNYFEINNISKYGNLTMVLKSVFMFSLFLVPYFLMVTGVFTEPLILLVFWMVMGFGMAGIGLSVMHDANHRSYSKNKALNKIMSYSLLLLGGYTHTWQYQHNTLHHSFTNIEGYDEDIDTIAILRFSPNKPLYKIHRFQYIYAWFLYGLMTITWTTNKDFKQLIRYHKEGALLSQDKSFARMLIELIVTKIAYYLYILVIPILVLPVPWWLMIIYYLSMHYISGFIFGVIFQTAHVMPTSKFPVPEKDGNIYNNWAIHQLSTTTDYSPKSRFFSWLIGGLNYQIEHHLFPNICHVHYRKIAGIVRETAAKFGVQYNVQLNFIRALSVHAKMLRQLGR